MLNTGLLLSKPGESGYAIYRRLLIANLTTRYITREMSKEFEHYQFKLSREIGTGGISHRLANLARQKEEQYLKKHNLAKNKDRNIDLYVKYRPQKHCPCCAENAYHSMLFDLSWIETCPIHKTELLRCCPGCRRRWPCACEIINNHCHICGRDLQVKKLVKTYSSFFEHKSYFNLMEYAEQLLLREHFKSATRYKNKTNYLTFYTPKMEDINIFQVSIILSRFKSQKPTKNLLNMLDLPIYRILTKTYKLKSKTGSHSCQSQIDILKVKLTELVKRKLYNALLQSRLSKHKPGTCLYPEYACVPCATWNFWRALVDKEFNIKSYSSVCWLKFLDKFYGSYRPNIPRLCTNLYEYNEHSKGSFRNLLGKFTVPNSLQSLIYYIDLWTLAICIFHDLVYYNKQNAHNNISSKFQNDMASESLMVLSNSNFCPILMERINEYEIKVFFPKDLIFTQLPMPKYIESLAY